MKKNIQSYGIAIAAVMGLFASVMSGGAYAQERVSHSSASIGVEVTDDVIEGVRARNFEIKKSTIEFILRKYNSPLVPYSEAFVYAAYTYKLDPYLVVSISGLESTFGRHMLQGSYNAWGWGGGTLYLGSWESAIDTISKALREDYYNAGAYTLADVGKRYAASKTWTPRVENFIRQFYNAEWKIRRMTGVLISEDLSGEASVL